MVVDFFSRGCYLKKSVKICVFNNLTRMLYLFQYLPKRYYCYFSNFSAAILMGKPFHFRVEIIAEKEKYNLSGVGD